MYCKHCNFKLEGAFENAKFCPSCGRQLDLSEENEEETLSCAELIDKLLEGEGEEKDWELLKLFFTTDSFDHDEIAEKIAEAHSTAVEDNDDDVLTVIADIVEYLKEAGKEDILDGYEVVELDEDDEYEEDDFEDDEYEEDDFEDDEYEEDDVGDEEEEASFVADDETEELSAESEAAASVLSDKEDDYDLVQGSLADTAYALATIGNNVFSQEYEKDLEQYFVADVWENCESRFTGIDKRIAPKLFDNGSGEILSSDQYVGNLKEYNARIKKELNSVKPAVKKVKKNFEDRKRAEWEKALSKAKKGCYMRGVFLAVLCLIGIGLMALTFIVSGNDFRIFPYIDIMAASILVALISFVVIGGCLMSFYWKSYEKKHKSVHGNHIRYRINAIFRFILIVLSLGIIGGIIAGAIFLNKAVSEGAVTMPDDIFSIVISLVSGVVIGFSIGLFILSIPKAVGITIKAKRENPAHQTGSAAVSMKKYGSVSLIVAIVLIAIFCGINLFSQKTIVSEAGDFSYISLVSTDDAILTGVDLSYFDDNEEGLLPTEVGGRKVSAVAKGWIEENTSVKTLTAGGDVSFQKDSLKNLKGLQTLTFRAEYPLKEYFGGVIPSTLRTVNIIGNNAITLTSDMFDGCENVREININAPVYDLYSDVFDDRPEWLAKCVERYGVAYLTVGEREFALKAVPDAEEIEINFNENIVAKGFFNSLEGNGSVSLIITGNIPTEGSAHPVEMKDLGDEKAFEKITSITIDGLKGSYDLSVFKNIKEVKAYSLSFSDVQNFTNVFGAAASSIETLELSGGTVWEGYLGGLVGLRTLILNNNDVYPGALDFELSQPLTVICNDYTSLMDGWAGDNEVKIIRVEDTDNLYAEDKIYYELSSNGKAKVVSYAGSEVNLVVPDTVGKDGTTYTVTEINGDAFADASFLTSLVLPDTLESIPVGLLNGCRSLTALTVPFIGNDSNNPSETHFGSIFAPNSNNSDTVPESLVSVTVNGGIIYNSAFENCANVREVTFGELVTLIGENLFADSAIRKLNYDAASAASGYTVYYGGDYFGLGEEVLDVSFGENVISLPDGLFSKTTLGEITVKSAQTYSLLAACGERVFARRESDETVYTYKTPDGNGCIHEAGDFWYFDEDGIKELSLHSVNPVDCTLPSEAVCSVCGAKIQCEGKENHDLTVTARYEFNNIICRYECENCEAEGESTVFSVDSSRWIVSEENGVIQFESDIVMVKNGLATLILTSYEDVTFSFDYVVSSESGFDKFTVTSDVYSLSAVSGEVSDTSGDITLGEGQKITFVYDKDSSTNKGEDKVVIRLNFGERDE